MQQRYVSQELTHFIGASLQPNEDAQYQLMRDVLRSGLLRNPKFGDGFGYGISPVADSLGESLSAPVVCFCDIPLEHFQIHITKYGRFGLAFRKEFLVACGATPVFYVAKPAVTLPVLTAMFNFDRPAHERGPRRDQAALFEAKPRYVYFELWKQAATRMWFEISSRAPGTESYEFMQGGWWTDYFEFMNLYIFGYLKYMDVGLADDDPNNFYMEREWRVLNEVRFKLDDVRRVLIPERFSRTFRQDFPAYFGQVSFLE